jgi:CBS domain-containing protein
MKGVSNQVDDITKVMEFEHAKSNFFAAARMGLETSSTWLHGKRMSTSDLILKELLPIAREGLDSVKVEKADVDNYLGIIEERIQTGRTGSRWILDSFTYLKKHTTKDETTAAITAAMLKNQLHDLPVHTWKSASLDDLETWHPNSLLVEEFMTTDLFTVQKEDIVEMVAEMIDWQKIRYVPVEDKEGKLVGLMSSRILLRYYNKMAAAGTFKSTEVKSVMLKNPITIHPEANILQVMDIMEKNGIGCLPVVSNSKLVGMITEANFLHITKRLFLRLAKQSSDEITRKKEK